MQSKRTLSNTSVSDTETNTNKGMFLGFLGVVLFSLTLPVNRLIIPYFDPIFIGMGRSVVAAMLAIPILIIFRQSLPTLSQIKQLLLTSLGIIAGFPVFTALAMQTVPASHGSVVIGLLPLMTAIFAVILSNERPSKGFWVAASVGAALVVIYSLLQGGMKVHIGDIYLVIASLLGAFGYAMSGKISRELGGWQVICWVNIVGLPYTLITSWLFQPVSFSDIPSNMWLGFLYLAFVSQLFGFFLWNRGLVLGGIARVSQTQLLQPFLSIFASILLLNEQIDFITYCFAIAVVLAIAVTRKMQIKTSRTN